MGPAALAPERRFVLAWRDEQFDIDRSRQSTLSPARCVAGRRHSGRAVGGAGGLGRLRPPALPEIEAACSAAAPRLAGGGRLVYAGAGTSARVAAADAAELSPTFGFGPERIVLLIAGGPAALQTSVEDAEDDATAAEAGLARHAVGAGDVLIAVAASGATPFTVAAAVAARAAGAMTVGIAGVAACRLLQVVEHAILLRSGAEPIAGSTRLKAGTAQKVALNLISTLLMVRLGHVHDGLMVDMQPRNAKLRQRAVAMVLRIVGGDDQAAAQRALDASGGNVKRAVLRLRGLDSGAIEPALARGGGSLRAVLRELEP